MPMTFLSALKYLIQCKAANARINSGFFKDNLVIVIGIPKSSSQNTTRCLRVIQDAYGPKLGNLTYRPPLSQGRYNRGNNTGELQIEAVADCLDGGVLHCHSTPNGRTLLILDALKSKYIVLLRYPLDHLIGIYCQALPSFQGPRDSASPDWIYHPIRPISGGVFDGNRNTDEVIAHLINGGFLYAALMWMSTWLSIRKPDQSIVIRYEDLRDDLRPTLQELTRFLFGSNLDDNIWGQAEARYGEDERHPYGISPFQYPRGWSGAPDCRRRYISSENYQQYSEVVTRFVENNEGGAALLRIYPDLIDASGRTVETVDG